MKTIASLALIAVLALTTGCAVNTVTVHHTGDVVIDNSKGKCFTAE